MPELLGQYGQDDDGPFWLHQRNYLVSPLLTEQDVDATCAVLGLSSKGDTRQDPFVPPAELQRECPLGVVATALLKGSHSVAQRQALIVQLVEAPWADVLSSGWPLFLLLACISQDAPSADVEGHVLRVVRARGREAMLAALVEEAGRAVARARDADDVPRHVWQPGQDLREVVSVAEHVLGSIQQEVRQENITDRGLWLGMHRLQEAIALRGTCPPGSFAVALQTMGVDYRMCVRQPESLGTWLGSSLVDKRIVNHGSWPECSVPAQLLPPSRCIVLDVGANVGACTLLFARLGHGVIAVEPEPSNRLLLRASLGLPQSAEFGRVSVSAAAAGEVEGEARIARDLSNAGHSDIISEGSAQEGLVVSTVRAARLDRLVPELAQNLGGDVSEVCLMKVDVEGGSALGALRGAMELLASPALRVVVFEYVPSDPGHTVEELWLLSHAGFTIFGTGAGVEERAFAPEEFDALTAQLRSEGRLGTSLAALKL